MWCTIRYWVLAVSILLVLWFAPGREPEQPEVIGGDFTLTDTRGKPLGAKELIGKPAIIYLGYAHCPDVCPTTLSMLGRVLAKLGDKASQLQVVFISVDAQDTPQSLAEFLKPFNPSIIGLTGDKDKIGQVVKLYKAYVKGPEKPAPGNMLIEHSGLLYLMDARGRYNRHFDATAQEAEILQALEAVLK